MRKRDGTLSEFFLLVNQNKSQRNRFRDHECGPERCFFEVRWHTSKEKSEPFQNIFLLLNQNKNQRNRFRDHECRPESCFLM